MSFIEKGFQSSMLKLKVKYKLLLIWLGSIALTLTVMAALFEYQIGALHQQDARTAISNAISILHHDLELEVQQAEQSSLTLAARSDLVSSMSMIDSYQDTANYQANIFDVEKSKVAQELAQHAIATGTDILALFDSHGLLTAFYLSTAAGGNGAGYVSFKDAKQIPFVQNAKGGFNATDDAYMAAIMRQLGHLDRTQSHLPKISHAKNSYLLVSAAKAMERQRTSGSVQRVGVLVVGRALGEAFKLSVSRAAAMSFRILYPDEQDQVTQLSALDAQVIAKDVPRLVLNGNPTPDHSADHTWFSTNDLYVGAVRMERHKASHFYLIFTQYKDALQSTLNAFRNTVLMVLFVTGLTLLPVGAFFLNRFITRPIENLVTCADNLRRGHHQAMEDFSAADEFGELATSFQVMSSAVLAREQSLKESQASLKDAQRIARIGNWEWDLSTDDVNFSDELHAILGRGGDAMATTFEGLLTSVHPDDAHTLKRRIFESLENNSTFQMEHRIVLPDGSERYVIHHGETQQNGDKATRLNATVQDITERYLLERAKSDLISTVSHELRTPLTSITGTLGLAVGGVLGDLPEQLKIMLSTADKNAKRLGLLIDDLLDIEKIANGSMTFEFKATNVGEIFRCAVEANQSLAQAQGVTFTIEGDVDNMEVCGDADRMSQVMTNLLSNAVKFSSAKDKVRIRATRAGRVIAISVSDRGPPV